ncbi:hypothetical protein [Thioalkalivibrio sp.]|uniref:hypothetical protein n=1 Tax=Thioalkalivibrio sp. TaxID=2093813 RepID=UPI0012D69384|nr:hypothetical protein [Thioalkalivibrio sp.]TVP82468.1 MAG: hypothetical protein EA346_02500 [Thioalkalivibrio sp.]
MRLLLGGLVSMLAGLALLLAQVSRAIEPGLALSLIAYAAAFGGTVVAIAGLIQLLSVRRMD